MRLRRILIIFTVVIFCIASVFIINGEYAKIELGAVSGNSVIPESKISSEIRKYLATKKYFVLNTNSMFVLNKDDLQAQLLEIFPRISEIYIDTHDKKLQITISEHVATSIICSNNSPETGKLCFALDNRGVLVDTSPKVSPNIADTFEIEYLSDTTLVLGDSIDEYVFDYEKFIEFRDVIENEFSLEISSVSITANKDIKFFLSYVDSRYYSIHDEQPYIIVSPEMGYETILNNIRIVFESESFNEMFQARAQDLESIDVRFEGRVSHTFTPIKN
tara:strand:+ start:11333 stop:12160 length:828 start_codon:yes stop_codon:yes gene_type:complete